MDVSAPPVPARPGRKKTANLRPDTKGKFEVLGRLSSVRQRVCAFAEVEAANPESAPEWAVYDAVADDYCCLRAELAALKQEYAALQQQHAEVKIQLRNVKGGVTNAKRKNIARFSSPVIKRVKMSSSSRTNTRRDMKKLLDNCLPHHLSAFMPVQCCGGRRPCCPSHRTDTYTHARPRRTPTPSVGRTATTV